MKCLLTVIAFFAIRPGVNAQGKTFPQDFIGKWKGTMEFSASRGRPPRPMDYELHITPSKDTAGQYIWQEGYSPDLRNYLLVPEDSVKGWWIMNKPDGIMVQVAWVGTRLISSYTSGGRTFVDFYHIENGNLISESIHYFTEPEIRTGKGTSELPFVESFGISGYFRAVLKKQ